MVCFSNLKNAWPDNGLLGGKNWYFSPEPLRLEDKDYRELERMGPVLASFQQAQDRIYRRSAKGRIDSWVADLLDAGKPQWMVDHQRAGEQAEVVPRVIRPDLMWTEAGFAISELDSVPGGMGVTAWMGQVYGDVLGGQNGIPEALSSLLPPGGRKIWMSEESSDYKPEMEWLGQFMGDVSVEDAAEWVGESGYRFFELFDWEAIPALANREERAGLTPPIKPLFEEKLWLALLHTPGLKSVWEQELRGKQLNQLKSWVPMGWTLDPTPLPPHGALPGLDVHSWQEVGALSQKQRRLVLKVSGFSELAWGSRGVYIGHDEPGEEWAGRINSALVDFERQPWMMQEFREAKVIEHPYFEPETGEVKTLKGRARLCPYYFVLGNSVRLGGCLATIVPADKKKIHGMEDAILVPVAAAEAD